MSFDRAEDTQPNVILGCVLRCAAGNEVVWNLGTMDSGESHTITVNALVDVDVSSGELITIPVQVSAASLGGSIDQLNTIAVYNLPSAELVLSASTDPVTANETFTYRLDIGNVTENSLSTLQLRASLPSEVIVIGVSDSGMEMTPNEVVWDISNLIAGASLHREITVMANSAITGDILKAHAELSYDGGLSVDNRSDQVVTVVATELPLKLDISTSASPVATGEHLLYTMTVSNASLQPVNNARVLLRVPDELTFNRTEDAQPNVSPGCDTTCIAGNEANWSLGTLAVGESRTISVNALVDATLFNGDLIAAPVRLTATDLGDTIDRVVTVAVFDATVVDLALSSSTDPVTADETFTYHLDDQRH